MALQLISRAEWGARPARRRSSGTLNGPVTCHWEGPTIKINGQISWDHAKCAQIVRQIQNFHMDGRGWSDIAYNFLECPHGFTFEGRGLNVVNAANGTNAGNKTSHTICCIAGTDNPWTLEERIGFKDAVSYISSTGHAENWAIGHRDHHSTDCPGDQRYAWVHAGMPIDGGVTPSPATPPPTPVPVAETDPVLRRGSKGPAVAWVQNILNLHTGGLAVDQDFGPATEGRIKAVQRVFGLVDDGVVGPKTYEVLRILEKGTGGFGGLPFSDKPVLRQGAKGGFVQYLQTVISQRFGGNIVVDADFGPKTKARVIDVQKQNHLTQDGVVGPITWGVIDRTAVS